VRPPKDKRRHKHAFEIAEVLGNSEVVAFLRYLSRGRRYIEQFLQYDIEIQHPLLMGSSLRIVHSWITQVIEVLGLWNHLSCEVPKMIQCLPYEITPAMTLCCQSVVVVVSLPKASLDIITCYPGLFFKSSTLLHLYQRPIKCIV
jgi:hypothetical protein